MALETLESVVGVMRLMMGAEKTVSAFYHACAERFHGNEDFWKQLEHEETIHAELLSRILGSVRKKPEESQIGKASSIPVVNSFIEGVKGDLRKVRAGQMDEDTAIFEAYHIESTFIEQKYTEAIVTENAKYLSVIDQLRNETGGHKERIAKRMKRHKSYDPPDSKALPEAQKE